MRRACGASTGWGKSKAMLSDGRTIDISNAEGSPLAIWPQTIANHHKIEDAQRLFKEAGVWR